MVIESIVGTLIAQAVNKVIAKMDDAKKDIRTVIVQEKADSFSCTEIDRAISTKQKWSQTPDLEFNNVLKKTSKVKEISLIPDAGFKIKGKVIITIDKVTVVKSKSFGAFTDAVDFVLKINTTIKRDEKVRVFLLSSDGTAVALAVHVSFGD